MRKSINNICMSVSLWATISIIGLTLLAGGITFLQNITQLHKEGKNKLKMIAPIIMNSLSGELMIGDDRAIKAILEDFREKYNLHTIIISNNIITCPENKFFSNSNYVCFDGVMPDISPKYYIMMTSSGIKLASDTLEIFFIWTLLPLILLGVIIAYIIKKKLKYSIVDPIRSLSNNPETWRLNGSGIAREVVEVSQRLLNYINERDAQITYSEKLKGEASIGRLASQLAHDIRSPLIALDIIIKDIKNIPEEQRIVMRNSANRINDIANNLLTQYRQ
ncbi:MAG TPA: hypothetical protein VJN02_07475, partial [Gammaproteobacteria bacterium]|nr:hypothetical protein [Gammaproteobacteria bacterium]